LSDFSINPPAIGPGFRLCAALCFEFEALVAACTKVIWEETRGVQEGRNEPLFSRFRP
jgi:hypothetical protein